MIAIRKIRPSDTPEVQSLVRDIMESEFSADAHRFAFHDLADPVQYYGGSKDIFIVAEKDGHIIGTVAIKEDAPASALLRRIFVRKEWRGKGYGDKLLQRALEFCFEHDYQTVSFRGTDKMQSALRLCLKQGFREEDIPLGNEFNMFILTKRLKPPTHPPHGKTPPPA